MTKAFITGATGNIGTHLTKHLQSLGVNFTAGSRNIETSHYPTVKINYEDKHDLRQAFDGHDVLFLLTPDTEHSITWVKTAVDAAIDAGIKHIVRSSGIGADDQSDYLVFRELGIIESYIKASGLAYTMIQPNSFMQNFATFQNLAVRNGRVFLPHDRTRVSYVDVRDVALAAAHVIRDVNKHQAKTYVITGGEAISDQELLNEIGRVLGKNIQYISISEEEAIAAFRKYHLPEYNIEQLVSLYRADRDGHTSFISDDFQLITNNKPRTAREFALDYQQHWS